MESVLTLLIGGIFVIVYQWLSNKNEKEKFREFVRSIKSPTIEKYEEVIEEFKDTESKEADEIVDLNEIEPEQLLKRLKD
jgi:hypothetical protein